MARTPLDLDDLVEHWTLLKDEQALVSGKRGATRLGFAVLLKFYTQPGRFPRGRFELPGEAVEFVIDEGHELFQRHAVAIAPVFQ